MFLYNSLLLLCRAVSKYQSQIGWEGHGLCPVSEGTCGVWWELGEQRQDGAVPPPRSLSPLPQGTVPT